MKALDIINQLQIVLPQISNLFSTTITAVSITASGTTATVTTSSPHGFAVNRVVAISGAFAPIVITAITRVGTIATALTSTAHDLTDGFFDNVTLSGSNEAEFNGAFPFLNQDNRKTFTFTVADSGPTTGTGSPLLEDPGNPVGYNGLITIVTVPTTTTFTYTLDQPLTEAATGTILIHSDLRVSGAATIDRALSLYTKQTGTDLWAFVVLDDASVSKDRTSRNDAVSSLGPGSDRRQQLIQNCTVYVFSKATNSLSGRSVRDTMVDVRKLLLKSIVGVKFESDLDSQNGSGLVYVGDGIEIYDIAIYVHGFNFQLLTDITNNDTAAFGQAMYLTGGSGKTLSMPNIAALDVGKIIIVINRSGNSWTVDGDGSDTVEGDLTQTLTDGTTWQLMAVTTTKWVQV